MKSVTVQQAKARLSTLLEQVSKGEEVLIGKKGKEVAVLGPYPSGTAPRKPGLWKGKVRIAPDFEELPKEIRSAFQGQRP